MRYVIPNNLTVFRGIGSRLARIVVDNWTQLLPALQGSRGRRETDSFFFPELFIANYLIAYPLMIHQAYDLDIAGLSTTSCKDGLMTAFVYVFYIPTHVTRDDIKS